MQDDINRWGWPVEVRILGVNAAGRESGNEAVCDGRNLPWLQDTAAQNAWQKWHVKYRDVIILDADNVHVATFNLSENDLAYAKNYDALMSLLNKAAYSR